MPAVTAVLVVGAGLAGCSAAIRLARAGIAVELVERQPDVGVAGSGITLQGNALRELKALGIWEAVSRAGYPFDVTGLRAPDSAGTVVAEIPDARTGGPDLPAVMGMRRPELARILIGRATEAGVKVRLGVNPASLRQDRDGVDVAFADGSSGRFDLVVGADGVKSWTRRALGVELETTPVGMGIWRAFGPRPASVTRTDLFYGGPSFIAGYCPTSETTLYAYLVEPAQDRSTLTARERLATMKALSRPYHGPWDEIRDSLTDPERVSYTWFETHLMPAPWNRGRVVLIGDAAHTCPPTLAQGGAQALEDARVLTDLVTGHDRLDQNLWDAFHARRVNRVRAVVDASNLIARWQLDHVRGDVPAVMRRIAQLVAQPC